MPELPTGTVTFLFTDLEGSTRLWEEHPEAMQGALAHHDEILRDAVLAHGGHIVKTTGDGVHAAFATAARALDAAVGSQRSLGGVDWGSIGELRVRMGIHTGEAEVRDGDYYGSALNRAARLMSAAHGGQIVISLTTEELVRDALPGRVELRDLGEHRLRDLARADRVFELVLTDRPQNFGPLRSLDAFPGNLPVQLTSFVGREAELKLVTDALTDARLVTVTGAGGVGKTRLAIQIGAEVVPQYRDGVWLCELAAADGAESMIQVIAAALGVQSRPGVTLDGSIREFLRARQLLLVLDNCEHLVSAAGRFVEDVLREGPGVRVLATSREGLGVPGEYVWPLRSLSVPAERTADAVAASEAARLFVDRTRGTGTSFVLDESTAPSIAEICERLDGIPLAIELAAARATALSPAEIAELLDERFRLLTGGRRTAVERHQTLRATVDWSYSMLDDVERQVFDRLGVFAGTFDVSAARAVVADEGIEPWDVIDALSSLAAKSMLVVEPADDGTTRYLLLETLRAYARERLDAGVDADRWRRRHAEHFAELAEELGTAMVGADELASRRRLHADLDNLRAAVTWSLDSRVHEELGVQLVAGLGWSAGFDRTSGIYAWAERAVPAAERSAPGRRASALATAGMGAWVRGDIERARSLLTAAGRDGIPADCRSAGMAHGILAIVETVRGHPERGLELIAEAQALIEEQENYVWLGQLQQSRASVAIAMGDLELGRRASEESLRFQRSNGNPSGQATSLFFLAWTMWIDEPEEALALLEESIALTRAGATDVLLGSALSLAAIIRARAGERSASFNALHEAVVNSRESGDRPAIVTALNRAVIVLADIGSFEIAARLGGALTGTHLAQLSFTSPAEREQRDQALEAAREALGERYDELAARGAAMSDDELVAFALTELARLSAEAADG